MRVGRATSWLSPGGGKPSYGSPPPGSAGARLAVARFGYLRGGGVPRGSAVARVGRLRRASPRAARLSRGVGVARVGRLRRASPRAARPSRGVGVARVGRRAGRSSRGSLVCGGPVVMRVGRRVGRLSGASVVGAGRGAVVEAASRWVADLARRAAAGALSRVGGQERRRLCGGGPRANRLGRSGTEAEAAGGRVEARGFQGGGQRGGGDRLAVGAFHGQFAQGALADGQRQRVDRGL